MTASSTDPKQDPNMVYPPVENTAAMSDEEFQQYFMLHFMGVHPDAAALSLRRNENHHGNSDVAKAVGKLNDLFITVNEATNAFNPRLTILTRENYADDLTNKSFSYVVASLETIQNAKGFTDTVPVRYFCASRGYQAHYLIQSLIVEVFRRTREGYRPTLPIEPVEKREWYRHIFRECIQNLEESSICFFVDVIGRYAKDNEEEVLLVTQLLCDVAMENELGKVMVVFTAPVT